MRGEGNQILGRIYLIISSVVHKYNIIVFINLVCDGFKNNKFVNKF